MHGAKVEGTTLIINCTITEISCNLYGILCKQKYGNDLPLFKAKPQRHKTYFSNWGAVIFRNALAFFLFISQKNIAYAIGKRHKKMMHKQCIIF
jgi:hypothetical protein